MKNKEGKVSGKLIVLLVVTTLLVIGAVSFTCYYYFNIPKEVKENKLEGGSVNLTYSDDTSSLRLDSVVKLDDLDGMIINKADSYFDFTVDVALDEASKIEYEISVIPNKETTVPSKYIKVYLEKLQTGSFVSVSEPMLLKPIKEKNDFGSKPGSMILYNNSLRRSLSDNYRLRAWVDNTSQYVVSPTDKIVLDVEVNGKAS